MEISAPGGTSVPLMLLLWTKPSWLSVKAACWNPARRTTSQPHAHECMTRWREERTGLLQVAVYKKVYFVAGKAHCAGMQRRIPLAGAENRTRRVTKRTLGSSSPAVLDGEQRDVRRSIPSPRSRNSQLTVGPPKRKRNFTESKTSKSSPTFHRPLP